MRHDKKWRTFVSDPDQGRRGAPERVRDNVPVGV